ncbi:MAG: PLP-dependent aminotransferase family protein [Ectothiorhodospiraceae bacterium]|nr:PLP-dependent aminotransferase family protein [Ectothiorhodospiraceae bacterium]
MRRCSTLTTARSSGQSAHLRCDDAPRARTDQVTQSRQESRGGARGLLLDALCVERAGRHPLHRQVYEALRDAVLAGRVRPGTRLPSTRSLASQLGVSRNTVISAYEQLTSEGFLESRAGAGTRVCAVFPERPSGTPTRALVRARTTPPPTVSRRGALIGATLRPTSPATATAFQPGLPALDQFPFAIWNRLLTRAARQLDRAELGYGASGGLPALRETVAEYLTASRGVRCRPSQVVVTGGAQAALDLATRMLLDPGDEAWLEEPGYSGARGALLAAGARLRPVPVDDEGLDVEHAAAHFPRARLAYVTPSYQFPCGVTMSLERRLSLIDWAERAGAWVIEDDYDSEYRYRGRPLNALQGLDDGERVVYLGTFSKTLFPALRVAYLVVPEPLADAFRNALRITGQDASVPVQAALAAFIGEGHFAAHVRRMRALYASRQRRFVELASARVGDWLDIRPTDAGMQIAATLRVAGDDRAVSAAAARRGLVAPPLSGLHLGPVTRSGLFLGYAGIDDARLESSLERLADALREVLGADPAHS